MPAKRYERPSLVSKITFVRVLKNASSFVVQTKVYYHYLTTDTHSGLKYFSLKKYGLQ